MPAWILIINAGLGSMDPRARMPGCPVFCLLRSMKHKTRKTGQVGSCRPDIQLKETETGDKLSLGGVDDNKDGYDMINYRNHRSLPTSNNLKVGLKFYYQYYL